MPLFTLFDPNGHPCKGMNASRETVALEPGEWALLQNVRIDNGVFKVRDGMQDLSASGLPNGWCVGAKQLTLNGVDYVFMAVDTGSSIRVLASTGIAFTEWTGTGLGAWNETRFVSGVTPAAYKRVEFVVVKAPTRADSGILSGTADQDIVIASDGVKAIASNATDAAFKPMPRLTPGPDFVKYRAEATFPDFMTISSGLSGSSTSDADVVAATSTSYTPTSGLGPLIQFTTSADTDDWGQLEWTTANNMFQGPGMALMYGTAATDFWDNFALLVYDSTAAALKTIWDPTSTTTFNDRPTVITVDATDDIEMAVFPLDPANTPVADNASRLRLVYKGPASPSAAIDFYLMGWYALGAMPGGTTFQMSSYAPRGYSESEATQLEDVGGVDTTQLGMTDKRNTWNIPVSQLVTYAYRLTWQAPTTADVLNGSAYALFYARFPDSDDLGYRPDTHYLVGQAQFATAGSGFESGYSSGGLQATTVNSNVLLPREAPKPFHRPLMPFKSACWADGRLILGGVKKDDSASYFGGYFVSKKGDPFDFSEFERFLPDGTLDLTGPVIVPLGGEIPQAIVTISNSRSQDEVTTPMVIVTDKGVWAVNTSDALTLLRPRYLAPYGTRAPDSVVAGGGAVFYFDDARQIRRVAQGVDSPSIWRVDALWNGIPSSTTRTGSNPQSRPRQDRVACEYFKDKLYVFYTATGQTYNQSVSVYDTLRDVWYDDVLASGNIEKPFIWPVAGETPQLRGASVGDDTSTYDSAPMLFQLEKPTIGADNAASYTINLLTGYIHFKKQGGEEPWQYYAISEVGIVCDKMTSGSLSVVLTVLPSGDTATGTIDLDDDVSGSFVIRWARDSNGNKVTIPAGAAYQISIQGTYSAGSRIMAVYFRHHQAAPGTDVKAS